MTATDISDLENQFEDEENEKICRACHSRKPGTIRVPGAGGDGGGDGVSHGGGTGGVGGVCGAAVRRAVHLPPAGRFRAADLARPPEPQRARPRRFAPTF